MVKKKILSVKVEKDAKKDITRKNKEGYNIVYPHFQAKGKFKDVSLDFSEYDTHARISFEFPDGKSYLNKRTEYGEEFRAINGDLVILRYKLDNKGNHIITSVEVIK